MSVYPDIKGDTLILPFYNCRRWDNISDNGNIVNDSDYDATQIKRSNRTPVLPGLPALPGSVAPSNNNVSNNGDVVNGGKQYSIGMDDKSLQRSKQISPNSFDGEVNF